MTPVGAPPIPGTHAVASTTVPAWPIELKATMRLASRCATASSAALTRLTAAVTASHRLDVDGGTRNGGAAADTHVHSAAAAPIFGTTDTAATPSAGAPW